MKGKFEMKRLPVAELESNTGQIQGLPANPRQWTITEMRKLTKSLKETPELFEARGILVYPYNGKYVVLGGNMRLAASKELGFKDVPCIVAPADLSPAKLKEIVIKENASFGEWDWDKLANEWDELPLTDFNLPVWNTHTPEVVTPPTFQQPAYVPPMGDAAPQFVTPTPVQPQQAQVYQPNLNPTDGEKPVTDAEIAAAQTQLATAFQNQIQDMQEVICPCCGHKFYIKN